MNTHCIRRLHHILIGYLVLCFATSAPHAADALARALTVAAHVPLTLLAGITSLTPVAYANVDDPSKRPAFRQSKPAIWVNYADPRPKGDDADSGAKPSYLPQVAVNNVALNAAVAHTLFAVNIPLGPADMAPTLTYSPPTITKQIDINDPYGIPSYSFAADAGSFGNCWSDNLAPSIERNASLKTIIGVPYYERTLNVNGGPTPSASFKAADLPAAEIEQNDWSSLSWTPQPLTKASACSASETIQFWGSGLAIDETNAPIAEFSEIRNNTCNSFSKWSWPNRIIDRNGNTLHFTYSNVIEAVGAFSVDIQSGWDYNTTMLRVPTCVSNVASADALLLATELFSQDIASQSTNIYKSTPTVTNLVHMRNGQALRAAQFTYQDWPYINNEVTKYTLRLLSSVRLPNGDLVTNIYSPATLDPSVNGVSLPLLTQIITPAGTTVIEYSDLTLVTYENSLSSKYEPSSILVITDNGLTTNSYTRIAHSYDCRTGTGSATTETISPAGTYDYKDYGLFYEPLNMQWYGCETENVLDEELLRRYELDSRFRYTSLTRYPTGENGPSDINHFAYDDHDNLTSATDPYDNITSYLYAANKLDQTCVTDPRGVVNSNIFDACGNLLVTMEDYNGLRRTASNLYNTAGQVIKSFDPLGRITRSFYSTNRTAGTISSYTSAEPTDTDFGFLVATRDAVDRVTTYSYDTLGRQIEVNAPGNSESARYITRNAYDIMDRTTATYFPDSTYISNVYNAAGYPVRARDRAGRWTDNTYDDAGHLVRVDYPNNDWVKKEYTGNLVSKLMDAAANTTEYFYCREQLTGVRFPDGSTRAAGFDNFNRQIWAVDERGVAVTNAYDKLDRVIASAYVPFTTENEMPADVTSVPASLTPSTCNWSLIYGGFDNQVISYAYDTVGNLTNLADWAGTLTNTYDHLNRPVFSFTQFASAPSLFYSLLNCYDLADNCTTQDFVSDYLPIKTTYTYDSLNRLTCVWGRPRALDISCSYTYNANGNVAWKRYYQSSTQIALQLHSYDTENRLVTIIGGGPIVEYQYNNAQQISEMHETISGTERQFKYQYDNRDQLTQETEWLSCGGDDWEEGPPNSYSYDNAQNRVSAVTTGQAIHEYYGYSIANKMTNIWRGSQSASSRYWYDLAGNLSTSIVKNVTNCYYYNVQNKLVKIVGTNFVNEFKYNSRNERIAVGIGPSTNSLVWRYDACQGPLTLAEFNSNNEITRWYVRGLGIAEGIGDVIAEVEVLDSPKPHYYLSNHRGDTLVVLNPDGAANSTFRHDAFGNCYAATGPFTPRYTFSTKEFLADAKLYLYAYRVYDPVAGRWTQRDPIDYQDSINLYQFCGNNAVNWLDPLGLADIDLKGGKEETDPTSKTITIEAHGTGSGQYADTRGKMPKIVSPADMAKKVTAVPGYSKDKTVLDNSCSAGKEGGTAQELSKNIPNPVKGFTELTITIGPSPSSGRPSGLTNPDVNKPVYEVTYRNSTEISRTPVNAAVTTHNSVPNQATSK